MMRTQDFTPEFSFVSGLAFKIGIKGPMRWQIDDMEYSGMLEIVKATKDHPSRMYIYRVQIHDIKGRCVVSRAADERLGE